MGPIRGIAKNVFEQCIRSVHYYRLAYYLHLSPLLNWTERSFKEEQCQISFLSPHYNCMVSKCNIELLFTVGNPAESA